MLVRAFYRRWRTLIGEAWRFTLVGGFNVALNFVLFNALVIVLFSGSELKANVVATVVATTSSYLMNRSWTFRHRKTTRIPREYVLFIMFNAAALTIELAVMGFAKYGLGLTALWALNLAKLVGLGLGTVFRFWTYRTFVFAGGPATPADAAAAAAAASVAGGTPHTADGHAHAADTHTAAEHNGTSGHNGTAAGRSPTDEQRPATTRPATDQSPGSAAPRAPLTLPRPPTGPAEALAGPPG